MNGPLFFWKFPSLERRSDSVGCASLQYTIRNSQYNNAQFMYI